MATRYQVRLAEAVDVRPDAHATVVRCTCGWTLTVEGPTASMTVRIADRARGNHLEDVHPGQSATAASPVATAAGHDLVVGAASRRDHLWVRQAVCACGWTRTVVDRSPDRVAATVRARHGAHVAHGTGRTPARDYLVLAVLTAVVAVLLLVGASAAISAGH